MDGHLIRASVGVQLKLVPIVQTKMKQLKVALKILFIGFACLIPTPTYGNHGGFFKESKKKPIDEMDELFEKHDNVSCYKILQDVKDRLIFSTNNFL